MLRILYAVIVICKAQPLNLTKELVLSDFNKQFFWQKPPQGLFEVNTALYNGIDLEGQEIIQFADINSDMFTDILTVDKNR